MRKPFDGLKILDFTQALAGVFCSMYMGDFGADVIKVERYQYGEQSREWGPFGKDHYSAYYALFNRNKRSLSLDLSHPDAKEIVMKLVKESDVVLENFKTGTLDRLGIGYEEMKKVNPKIIYGSVSGFGLQGPLRNNASYDITAASLSGLMDRSGEPGGAPIKIGFSIGDNWSGTNLLSGLTMALLQRQATGFGCRFDIAMLDAVFYMMELPVMEYFYKGKVSPRNGNHDSEIAPGGSYRTKDGYVVIFCANEKQWQNCCRLLGMEHLLDDPRFADNEKRLENIKDLIDAIESVTMKMGKVEIEKILGEGKVAVGAVHTIRELMEDDEQLKDRHMLVETEHPMLGKYHTMGIPLKFSETPGDPVRRRPSLVGEQGREILSELGYSNEKIEKLEAEEVLFVSEVKDH